MLLKNHLIEVFKQASLENNFLLKENVFLFNNPNIDFTNEVLELFNTKTKSMKIIINSPK